MPQAMIPPDDNPLLTSPDESSKGNNDELPGGVEEPECEVVKLRIRRRVVGRRLDKYLHGRFPRLSRTMIQKLISQGQITVNGKVAKRSYEPAGDDEVTIRLPPPPPTEIIPEDIPINVIYEDPYLLAINKQPGIICHPSRPGQGGTLANALAHYAGGQLAGGDDPFRPGIIHRLDKNTTGVMLVAKDDEAHWRISLQFERRHVQKTYFGIVEGEPRLDGDIIDQPLAAHPMIKERYLLPGFPTRDMLFKEAVTRYEVIERFKGFAVVLMYPKTGRTHQLRVHMSAIGHPLMGDTFYGGHFISESDITGRGHVEPLIEYQALHAQRISFTHPITSKPMELEAPVTERLLHIRELLRKHRSR